MTGEPDAWLCPLDVGLLPRQRGSASQQIAETLGMVDFILESPGGESGDVAVVQLLSCVRLFETP